MKPFASLGKIVLLFMCVAATLIASNKYIDGWAKSMDPMSLTQCISPLQEENHSSRNFFVDEKRGCYAMKWAIPRAYIISPFLELISHKPIRDEVVTLHVGIPDLTPGARFPKDRKISFFSELSIHPLHSGSFKRDVFEHTKEVYEGIAGLKDTGKIINGLKLYEERPHNWAEFHDIFLFPEDHTQPFAQCLFRPNEHFDKFLNKNIVCTIKSPINDEVYIQYYLDYSQLPELTAINNSLTKLVQSFIN